MNMDLIYGILAAIGLSMVIMFFQGIRRRKSWQGTVTKIKRIETKDDDGLTNIRYKIYYRTDTGKSSHFTITDNYMDNYFESLYPGIKEGSMLVKKSGSDYPDMVR